MKTLGTPTHPGAATHWGVLDPRALPGPPSEYQRKVPPPPPPDCFWQEEGERNPVEIHPSPLFFLTRPALRGNWVIRAWPAGLGSQPNQPGEGKYPPAALLSDKTEKHL